MEHLKCFWVFLNMLQKYVLVFLIQTQIFIEGLYFFFLPCNLVRTFALEQILLIIFLILLFDQSFPV